VKPGSSHYLLLSIIVIGLFLNTGCSTKTTIADTATPTSQLIITATLPPTLTPRPSPTLAPATATVPVTPADGQTTSQLNVRSGPTADSDQLGTINIFAKVQIVGKDSTSGWWMILYPESPTGTGWITAQFVQVPDSSGVPVIKPPPQLTGSVSTASDIPEGEGPTPEPENGSVSSPVPTPILATAFPDGDSAQSPGVSITLSAAATRSFNYSSDISTPEGDAEDWVQFLLSGQTGQQTTVAVMLDCSGSSDMNLELIQNNVLLQAWDNIACGQVSQLQLFLFVGAPYSLRLYPAQGNSSLNYVAYTVMVQLAK